MGMEKGTCRLCGQVSELSFEHIPSKSAFNDKPRVFETIDGLMSGHKYQKFRKGIGEYSLCETCNNITGSRYGRAYAEWVEQGLEWYDKLGNQGLFYLPYYLKPLNGLKQILIMAVMAKERTLIHHEELRAFILYPEAKYLPPKYEVYIYFNTEGIPRFVSDGVVTRVDIGRSSHVLAEVALPPFGYCICTKVKNQASLAEYQGLFDISWFSKYEYDEWTPLQLRLPTRETHEIFPLDYRDINEIQKQRDQAF